MMSSRSFSGIWSRNAFISVVLPDPVPPLMMPFFFLPISSTTVSRTCFGILPDSISSSEVYQRLNFRMVKRRAIDGRWRSHNGDTGAVRQAGIEDWILGRKVLAQNPRNPLDRGLQPVVRIRLGQRDMLHDPGPIRVHAGCPIDHQVRDGRVEQ